MQTLRTKLSALCFIACLSSSLALAQGAPRGFWPIADGDAAHEGWQRAETQITTDTVAKNFKFLWKLKLGNAPAKSALSETLLFPGMITGRGFKDFAFVADAHTVYAVDSELGNLVWKKDFTAARGAKSCGNLQVLTEAPQVIHFGAHKPAKPVKPPQPTPEATLAPSQRRVGGVAGGGYFGLKGIYVLTGDGLLHEQIMATGLDFAKPVPFVGEGAGSFALNLNDHVVYAASGAGCRNVADALWSIDIDTPQYPIHSYKSQKVPLAGLTGPAIGSDGTVYVATGSGADDAAAGDHADSVVALTAKELKVKDWYSAGGKTLNRGPVVFTYKDKELVAAPGKDGSLVLLDSDGLGGGDHHTPLAQTPTLTKMATGPSQWQSLATWKDKAGAVWLLASVHGAVNPQIKWTTDSSAAVHGSIVAFKVEEKGGHAVLTAGWVSPDLKNPAPPIVSNGVVFALDGGSAGAHAMLYALDASTGKQLFSSGDAVASYSNLAGLSVGDGHVFFTTHDNTLYSFGIPLEH